MVLDWVDLSSASIDLLHISFENFSMELTIFSKETHECKGMHAIQTGVPYTPPCINMQ